MTRDEIIIMTNEIGKAVRAQKPLKIAIENAQDRLGVSFNGEDRLFFEQLFYAVSNPK